jgi:hypothetical protein
MAEQQLTIEGVLTMFRKTDRRISKMFQEVARKQEEVAEQQKKTELAVERTNKTVGNLRSNVGKVIEHIGTCLDTPLLVVGGLSTATAGRCPLKAPPAQRSQSMSPEMNSLLDPDQKDHQATRNRSG